MSDRAYKKDMNIENLLRYVSPPRGLKKKGSTFRKYLEYFPTLVRLLF
jgi:hypothetical protein